MSKTILITGGAGFIGSHLVDKLIQEDYKVVVMDNLSAGTKGNLNPKAKFYNVDICSPKISQIFKKEKPKTVFHYAAQSRIKKSVENPIKDARINILGSLNLIQNFIKSSPGNIQNKNFVFASSVAVYGKTNIVPTPETCLMNPLSPYGISKLTTERYLSYYYKVFGLPYISLRMGNVYGPRQDPKSEAGIVAIFFGKILSKEQPIINGDGKQTCDFVYVNDVIRANILALNKKQIGIFNVGTAKETSINELFNVLKKITKFNVQKIHRPAKQGEQRRSCLDFSKAKKEWGWFPKYDLESGLDETFKWLKKFYTPKSF